MAITVTKKFNFSYGHYLPDYKGDCANMHGHNSNVEVEFEKNAHMPPSYEGMVIDFKHIKKYVQPIIDQLDHKCLNADIPFFTVNNPTAENMVAWVVNEIKLTSIGVGLVRVRVSETDDSYAEWRKD